MAQNEIIRNDFGDKNRNLAPDFSQAKQASVRRAEIWVTPELKEAAKALQNSWEISHAEQMATLNIRDVDLKFAGHEQRAAFLKALENLARLVNPNFPSTYPLPKPAEPESTVGDGVWLNFWHYYFLPNVFDAVMQDVTGTGLAIIPTQPEILNQAKAFLTAYGIDFVRMDLVADEGLDRSVVDSLTESLCQAHNQLRKFLQLLVKSLPEPGVHCVIIQGEDQFEVDGARKEFTGAALRALLVLALLREKADFLLEDFARLYHGGDVVDAKTDFDNAIRALKKELPQISAQTPAQNHRSITGLKFFIRIENSVIAKRLAGFYKNSRST